MLWMRSSSISLEILLKNNLLYIKFISKVIKIDWRAMTFVRITYKIKYKVKE